MVFSGIVECQGTILSCETIGEGTVLRVESIGFFEDATLGCSIAVNGVCLTVVEWTNDYAVFNIAPETCNRTNINTAEMKSGDFVNLERSLLSNSRNSGHYVQGHVDGVGEIISKVKDKDSLLCTIRVSENILSGIVPKGCICVDGVSLTVIDVNRQLRFFTFMYTMVTLPKKDVGKNVNIEVDVMGKYAIARNVRIEQSLKNIERHVCFMFFLNKKSIFFSYEILYLTNLSFFFQNIFSKYIFHFSI
eukprot:GSMAST32.ASY1.ANO1.997.1 assembled CDS